MIRWWYGSFMLALIVAFGMYADESFDMDLLQKAYTNCINGLSSKDPQEREHFLNTALSEYLQLADELRSAKVYANIGLLNIQLRKPGLGVWYLMTARTLDPTNQEIQTLARAAQKELGLEGKWFPPSPVEFFSLSTYLSPSEKNGVLMACVLLTATVFSLSLWLPGFGINLPAKWLLGTTLMLGALFYLLPMALLYPRAIVLNSVFLKATTAGEGIGGEGGLLSAGEELIVLTKQTAGNWLRVETTTGRIGYISGDAVRLVK